MDKRLIIAIDGPAASGKSTTARRLARRLGYVYLDTGAMYRACALQAKQSGISLEDPDAVLAMLEQLDIRIETSGDENVILLGGKDVSQDIRANAISKLSSDISALPAVRYRMVELQRELGAQGGVILDGRDIGTFVFPDADLKFFLTAAPEIRARRRWLELQQKGVTQEFDEVLRELQERDKNDSSRALAPLAIAADAIVVDTGSLSVEEQVDTLHALVRAHQEDIKVRLAEHSGFCFGVRRALRMAREARQDGAGVCTLGELIHNPHIVRELAAEGIGVAGSAAEISNSKVVLRSHGVSKQELASLKAGNNQIIDATCPYVERAQQLVASKPEIPVLILGDPEHPEVRGMLSYGNSLTRVVRPGEDPGGESWNTLCIVCQTTQKLANLEFLVLKVLPRCQELIVYNTICSATSLRQEAAVALARVSDLMVVIGGHNSANTRMLQDLCSRETRSLHVEEASELTEADLAGVQTIGLAAGASTPEEAIWEVYLKIHQLRGVPAAASRFGEIPTYKEESC